MKILDRYLSKEFIRYFVSALIVFSMLFILVEILNRSMKHGLSLALLKYSLFLLPFVMSQMAPIACLIASMFTLTTLSKNSELVAMHASGISLERIATTFVLIASILGFFNFFISDWIVPSTLKQSKIIFNREVRNDATYQYFRSQAIWYRAKNAIYNIHYFDPKQRQIHGVDIYLFDPKFQMTEHIHAKSAHHDNNEWTLQDGISTTFIDDFPISHHFKTKVASYITEHPKDLIELGNIEVLTFHELRNFIRKNKKAGFDTLRHEVNLHSKIAYAVACLVMAFLGIPFSTKGSRSGGVAASFGIGLAIAFFYWICLNTGISLGYSGAIPPIVSAWITNILFFMGGVYVLNRGQKMKKVWPF
ncbi:MAG: LPS export ABC transporter permease LptG [Deltaproteobacteria bacterium RIFCSPHIGHO2_02_FULL_40_11]|nr:MAG: LPS export ABC transporter permease LptG [Deltaproteobacteria bacterium RIFCSPHIGHO2_02_FULL_40_11]